MIQQNALPLDIRAQFQDLHDDYDEVFHPGIKRYINNSAAGSFEAQRNMAPVESPQRKGRLPHYAGKKLVELQEKFGQLEKLCVFKRPEDVAVYVEYLNPSFLAKKQSGGYRLVITFTDVGRYSKPRPSLFCIELSTQCSSRH